jgi:hypothetical protein
LDSKLDIERLSPTFIAQLDRRASSSRPACSGAALRIFTRKDRAYTMFVRIHLCARARNSRIKSEGDRKMFGFIIGAACAVGLAKVLRHRRGACGRMRGGPGGYGRRWLLRSLFERLATTPGQERVIMSALDELSENRKVVREELKQTRVELARAVEGGMIDDSTLDEAFARHDRLTAKLRVSFIEAVKKATEALDEAQRKDVARFIEGRGLFGGGPWTGGGGVWA